MNAQVTAMKQSLDQATTAYNTEQARLVESGLKSQERYEALKPLKAAQDAANRAYVDAAHGSIKKELNKIIAADAPRRRAEKLARSTWKAAKAGIAA